MVKLIRFFIPLFILCLLLSACAGDSKAEEDYAVVSFDTNHWQVTNAEGQVLYWRRNVTNDYDNKEDIYILDGDMENWDEDMVGIIGTLFHKKFTTFFSDSFTVQTRLPMQGYVGSFEVTFYKDGQCVQDLYVGGDYEGTATLCADGTVELQGNFRDFSCIHTFEQDGKRIELEGSGQRRIKIYLEDGDIVAEGMVGEYTITNYNLDANGYYEEISSEVRHGN